MGDRRMRAIILTFSEYVRLLDIRTPKSMEVWICEPSLSVRQVCKKTNHGFEYTGGGREARTCIECKKTYVGCSVCWSGISTAHPAFYNVGSNNCPIYCYYCKQLTLICDGCYNELCLKNNRKLDELYKCSICENMMCSSHLRDIACNTCHRIIRICAKQCLIESIVHDRILRTIECKPCHGLLYVQ
jgi:hypothetical protein